MPKRGRTGVEVTTGFFPLAFFFFFCKPRIVIDGTEYEKSWGTHFFIAQPGEHEITVYFPYIFMPRCGENSITVKVEPDQTTQIRFNMPPWIFTTGSLKEI